MAEGESESARANDRFTPVVEETVALDRLLDALAQRHRRYALYYLRERDGTASISELVSAVTSEFDCDRDRLREQFVDRHLPQLGMTGVVDYDLNDDRVSLSDNVDIVEGYLVSRVLDVTADHERKADE